MMRARRILPKCKLTCKWKENKMKSKIIRGIIGATKGDLEKYKLKCRMTVTMWLKRGRARLRAPASASERREVFEKRRE